jgi:hypothetical protein
MLDLSVPKVPFDIALPYGLSATVRPLTRLGWPQPRPQPGGRWRRSTGRPASAWRRRCRWAGCPTSRPRAIGMASTGPADPRAGGPAHCELGRRGAGRRTGTADAREHRRGDGALPSRRAVLSGVHAPAGPAERRRKRLRALCRGHFQPGGGPNTAGPATTPPCRARGEPVAVAPRAPRGRSFARPQAGAQPACRCRSLARSAPARSWPWQAAKEPTDGSALTASTPLISLQKHQPAATD